MLTAGPERLMTPLYASPEQLRGDFATAQGWYRKAAVEQRPAELATIQARLGYCLILLSKPAEAEHLLNQSLQIRTRLCGAQSDPVADTLYRLGRLNHMGMHLPRAESLFQQSLAIRRRVLGPEHPETANTMSALAIIFELRGKADDAESLRSRAPSIHRKLFGDPHVKYARGDFKYADRAYQDAVELSRQRMERTTSSTQELLAAWDQPYVNGKPEKLGRFFRKANSIIHRHTGPMNLCLLLVGMAKNLLLQNRPVEAEPLAREAY